MRLWLLLPALLALPLPIFAQVPPEKALATMKTPADLQVELFAHEPMLINPTSMDIDEKGRVWVAEAVNYRRKNFNRPIVREAGDRIQILIDTNGDGKADEAKTFYQGEDLYGPLSVMVLPQPKGGYRVLVAQSPDILEFTDADGDLKADGPPKKFLTGFGGFDHDHGVHGLTTGPDGKLYFTVGDQGVKGLQSADGKGRKWISNNTDCMAGTVWRCDLDGNNVELIAHNFRNNYEAAVDSFGEIWCSDNDDDGNQQTRICFVMPGGNYGYFPRGAGQTHWHEEQPGIVHKVLRTGFGSPTGMCFYEGDLLPKKYQNDILHTDAGPRELRSFKRIPKGAGYELEKTQMLTSTDNWFRPSDVCVAPDGSVFVCDWYDPGVGGHGMGDTTRGRIYRVTPAGHQGYKVPEVKLDTEDGLYEAFKSPCQTNRSVALSTYKSLPTNDAIYALAHRMMQSPDQHVAIRYYWQLGLLASPVAPEKRPNGVNSAFLNFMLAAGQEPGMDLHIPRINHSIFGLYSEFKNRSNSAKLEKEFGKASAATRRENLLTLRENNAKEMLQWFYPLAKLYDGEDQFFLAALNIACGTDPERRDKILADFEKHFPEWNDKVADLVWELRPKSMLPKMGQLLNDNKLSAKQKARIIDILATNADVSAGQSLLTVLSSDAPEEMKSQALQNLSLFLPTKWKKLVDDGAVDTVIAQLLKAKDTHVSAMKLIAAIRHNPSVKAVAAIANDQDSSTDARYEAYITLGDLQTLPALKALQATLENARTKKDTYMIVSAIGNSIPSRGQNAVAKEAIEILSVIVMQKDADEDIRRAAIEGLAGSRGGTQFLLTMKEQDKLPEMIIADVGRLLRNSPFQGERNKAMLLFPAPGKLDPKNLPTIPVLAKRIGNIEAGKAILAKSINSEVQCMKCHMVRGQGGQIGPDLSMIGKKASKENLYESLFLPSKAIADQYINWKLDTEDGQSIIGLIVNETETTITVRDANGKDYQVPVAGTERKKVLTSLMPEGLIATLTEDELVDVVEYLATLKTPSWTADYWHIAGPFPADNDAALDTKFGPETGSLDLNAKFKIGDSTITWRKLIPGSNGYFDLAAFHGENSTNSLSYMVRTVESPVDQEATILLGADDGCRVFVNGKQVFGHERHEAAKPERDAIKVSLKKGENTILLKINNGNNPHGFFCSIVSEQELKAGK